MRKILVLLIFLIIPFVGFSQYNWDLGIHAGAANCLTDVGSQGSSKDYSLRNIQYPETQFTVGGFARYKFSSLISGKLGLNWVRISGSDGRSGDRARRGRNVSFRNDLIELELTGQVFFYDQPDLGHTYRYRNDFKMYAFVGIAAFYSDPKTYYQGEWVRLRPLKTEGQSYSAIGVSVPLGVGLFFTLNKRHRIGWEFDARAAFTDYLDDVHGVYASDDELGNDPLRITLANRRGELPEDGSVPASANYGVTTTAAGEEIHHKRGDSSNKDDYFSTSIYYSYVLRGKSSFYRSKYGSIFKHKKYKHRKVRAKF